MSLVATQEFEFRQGQEFLFFCTAPGSVVEPTYPSIRWVLQFFPAGKAAGDGELNTHVHLVQSLRISTAIFLGKLYIRLFYKFQKKMK
jgi:hypothetical protein